MVISNRVAGRLRTVAAVAIGMALIVLVTVWYVSALLQQDFSLQRMMYAVLASGSLGAVLASYEVLYVESRYGRWIRELHFLLKLCLSVAVYLSLFAILGLVYFLFDPDSSDANQYFGFEIDRDTAFLLDVTAGFTSIVLLLAFVTIRRVIGGRELANILLGRYRNGVYEDRIFLFLDIESSTQIAEEMGDLGAYQFVSSFFFDIDEAVLEHRGEIHRYIGDEVVITWPLDRGLDDGHCLSCFFAIEDIIDRNAHRYQAQFGRVPRFKGGLHSGRVVAGFTGDSKQEISYFGDTVNTTARLESVSRDLGYRLVASAVVIDNTTVPDGLEAVALGDVPLRGKQKAMKLYGVQRKQAGQGRA